MTQAPTLNKQEGTIASWRVLDKNATSGMKREHEIIVKTFSDGREPLTRKYKLGSDEDEAQPMPMEHALKFLSDAAFIVLDPEGRRVPPPPKQEGGTGGFELPDHQTIANWDELAITALFKRCKVIPGSEAIKPNSPKEEMVAFLVKWRQAQNGGAEAIAQELVERLASGDTLAGQATPEQLNGLFGAENENPLLSALAAQGSPSVK